MTARTGEIARATVLHERHLRAMGSDCHLVVAGASARLLDVLVTRLGELEGRWSRFVPDSDISRLATAAGRSVTLHSDTALLVRRMVEARDRTGGWYDPTMHAEIAALGYDRDFAQLPTSTGTAVSAPVGRRPPVPIEVRGHSVRIPPGAGLDPGSIGKGLAADLLVDLATDHGASGVLVNLGGDVRARGLDVDGAPWGVVVADDAVDGAPTGPAWDRSTGTVLGLADGAVATSTVLRRRWALAGGGTAHHVLDPRTGGPAHHDLHTVTTVADRGWWADAAATAVLAAGPAGPGLAIELELRCRLTWSDGTQLGLGGWDEAVS